MLAFVVEAADWIGAHRTTAGLAGLLARAARKIGAQVSRAIGTDEYGWFNNVQRKQKAQDVRAERDSVSGGAGIYGW
jgi:hypothetical protein